MRHATAEVNEAEESMSIDELEFKNDAKDTVMAKVKDWVSVQDACR